MDRDRSDRGIAPALAEMIPVPRAVAPFRTIFACVFLLGLFALLAWEGISERSATFDEPLHVTAAYVISHFHDFRVDPEDPPLWLHGAALPQPADGLSIRRDSASWNRLPDDSGQKWEFSARTFNSAPDADSLLRASRAMMLVCGVLLGGLIGWWSWQLGCGIAAMVAVLFFALDPNFLAHSPLIKNDVSFAVAMLGTAYAVWQCGRRLSWASLAAAAIFPALGMAIKFTGVLLVAVGIVLMVVRVSMNRAWPCFGRDVETLRGKLLVAALVLATSALVCYATIWTCYGFRFAPTPQGLLLNSGNLLTNADKDLATRHPELGSQAGVVDRAGPFVASVLFAQRHHVLPQAWLYGLLYVRCNSLHRDAFLCGRYSATGFREYFPLAFLFKTPLATQAALLLSVALAATIATRARVSGRQVFKEDTMWTSACLAVPILIYGMASIGANLNIGLRHLLPIYPFLFIFIGWSAATSTRLVARQGRAAIAILAVGLAAESLSAFPNFIPFFNAACGGARGGLRLLSDSNLDWGQDLKLLAGWQQQHPQTPLFLCYFGSADPGYYHIHYTRLPDSESASDSSPPPLPAVPGVIAISATHLQGTYLPESLRRLYAPLRDREPIEVLGGSIYLFENLKSPASSATGLPDIPSCGPGS